MASPLRLTAVGADESLVEAAWTAVLAEFEDAEAAMSRFREDSEITRLHRARRPVLGVSRRLVVALSAADRAHRVTGGLFDARVLADLERLGSVGVRQSWLPEPARHNEPTSSDESSRLIVRAGRAGEIELLAPVDLGGIGKGLALRWARRRAAAILDGGFLLAAGGDIATQGMCGAEPWSIGIEDPAGVDTPVATCVLHADEAIATSSVRLGHWLADDIEVHHLIDPRTGDPGGAGLVAVTVAMPDPAWAEVWSKSLFLEGARGIRDAASRRGLATWWIDQEGELEMTPAARERTTWVR